MSWFASRIRGTSRRCWPALHAAEAGSGAAAAQPVRATSLAAVLASHILRDGEIVLMVLKPSLWFILLSSAWFVGAVLVASLAVAVLEHRGHDHRLFEIAGCLIAGRLMWATLQWMGRLFVLTDQRVLCVAGVFSVDVFDCPLRKVVRTRLVSTMREKLLWVGSIEIIPHEEAMPSAIWQTIARPRQVHERLLAAISRARQSGSGCE